MSYRGIALVLAMMLSVGLPIALLTCRCKRAWAELCGLSLSIGAGVASFVLFWVSLAGCTPTQTMLISVTATGLLGILLIVRCHRGQNNASLESQTFKANLTYALCALLIAIAILAVAVDATQSATLMHGDASAIWGLKARALAVSPLSQESPVFHDVAYSFSHLDYPLLVPALMAGVYGAAGAFDDPAAKSVFAILTLALALVLYSALARLASRLIAIASVAILMAAPMTLRWAGSGYADAVVALYVGGSAAYYALFLRDGRRSDLVIGLLHGLFLAFTKNEGMAISVALVACLGIVLLIRRRVGDLKWLAAGVICAAVALLPFLIWRSGIPKTHEDYGGRLTGFLASVQLSRLPFVLKSILLEGSDVSRWGLLWLLPAASIVAVRRIARPHFLFAALALVAQLTVYIAAYLVSPYTPERLVPGTLDRLMLQAAPLAILLFAAAFDSTDTSSEPSAANAQHSAPITK